MEVLEVQLRVPGHPMLEQPVRAALRNSEVFKTLPLHRISQVWRDPLPVQGCFIAQVHDSAVFISEDWTASIHGRRLIDCVSAMCAIVNELGREFGTQVEIWLPYYPGAPDNELYRQLDREQTIRRVKALGLWVLTLVAGGIAGALVQGLLQGGL